MQINKPFRMIAMAVLCLATLMSQVSVSFGQSDLADEDRATALFDIQMGKMRDGDFAKAMGDKFEQLSEGMSSEGPPPEKIERVFGAMTIPNSMADFEEMQFSPMAGMDYFFTIKFTDAEAADQMIEIMNEGDEVEVQGKTYLNNPEVEGMLGHRVDETTVEVGTEKYLTQSSRRLFTENLNAAFAKTPDVGFRLVLDLAGESDLIQELMGMATEQSGGDPMAAGMIELIDNAADLRICLDFDADTMLSIGMTGNNESDAEELQGGLDGILGMAKMVGGQATGEIPDPELAKAAKDIVMGLKATRDGTDVMIEIARPDNLVEAANGAMEMAEGMMMGGMGGPPSGIR